MSVPDRSVIADEFPIRLSNFDANTEVTVHLRTTDGRGTAFRQTTTIDPEGDADIGNSLRATAGSFAKRSPRSSETTLSSGITGGGMLRMPLHHLEPVGEAAPPTFVTDDPLEEDGATGIEHEVSVEVRASDREVATATGMRAYTAGGITEQRLPPEDLVGWLYDPPGLEPKPGILCLHGSQALVQRRQALRLAAQGYVTIALQYFGPQDVLPGHGTSFADMEDIPLEYFDRTVAWLTGRDGVLDDRIGVFGFSRGGEPALLTGAAFDGNATVVSYAGSAKVFPSAGGFVSPWTREGEPLYGSEQLLRSFSYTTIPELKEACADVNVTDCDVAGIPVEEIDGPVLFLTGGDDALWGAPHHSEYGVWRLARTGHSHPFAHVTYEGAGHIFTAPYVSYAGERTSDRFGGSHRANSRAAADAWVRTVDYFDQGLKQPNGME